jgi:hypothetical protein
MVNLDQISEDLFNKIRGRFPSVTIGDKEGNVTNEPSAARFFDFDYKTGERSLGKVSVSISEDEGLTIIYSKDFIQNENKLTQDEWYNFLRELRVFSKKRLMDFSVRDINKSNLNKRDYQFLANRSGDGNMNESKLYGTSRISYQKFDNARMVIKHTESINPDQPTGRTQKIGSIYIESADGERFKYPYKHLSGARAMTRHVSEGGKPYDDFGSHITGLSEELNKLRKFKTYMGRSAVMAESLAGYMDIVKERIGVVKKTIENLQKPAHYKEAFDNFEKPVMEEVPGDVAENWIDELTIRQFNEELADVFPYIYNLVKEGTKAKALGPDDLLGEAAGCPCNEPPGGKCTCPDNCPDCNCNESVSEDKDPCWKNYKMVGTKKKGGKTVPNCVPEEMQLEQGFDRMMGQFAEAEVGTVYMRFRERNSLEKDEKGNYKKVLVAFAGFANSPEELQMDTASRKYMKLTRKEDIVKAVKDVKNDKVFVGAKDMVVFVDNPAIAKKYPHLGEALNMLEQFGKKQGISVEYKAKDPDNQPEKGSGKKRVTQKWANPKNYKDPESERTTYFSIDNNRLMKFLQTKSPQIMNSFRPNLGMFVMDQAEYRKFRDWLKSEAVVSRFGETPVRVDKEKSFSQDKGREFEGVEQKEQKTPLGEFILSYFDYTSGQFPKGETAILTMVEKDYGEEFIEPAKAFIERINERVAEVMGFRQEPEIQELDNISRLAGL